MNNSKDISNNILVNINNYSDPVSNTLRLLFSVPRVYYDLALAWDEIFPGTLKILNKLVDSNLVEFQDKIIVNTLTGEYAWRSSKSTLRYKLSRKGIKLFSETTQDLRVLKDNFPHMSKHQQHNVYSILKILAESPASGASSSFCEQSLPMPGRSCRWWLSHLVDKGFVVILKNKIPDTREVIPAHWRVTKNLCKSVLYHSRKYNLDKKLTVEYRLKRTRFLQDITPSRINISGATDFDHDIEAQSIVAAILKSPRLAPSGVFNIEPRINLKVNSYKNPWKFSPKGDFDVFYQPDAELREVSTSTGKVVRSILEYERFQSRRDAWSHIEKFNGWLSLKSLPIEPAILRFVVDSESRLKSYVYLIEAFADYAIDNIDKMPLNDVTLAVTSTSRLKSAADPLEPSVWFRIKLPKPSSETIERAPVLHGKKSPYDDYFARNTRF
jgi:hypothetical protein